MSQVVIPKKNTKEVFDTCRGVGFNNLFSAVNTPNESKKRTEETTKAALEIYNKIAEQRAKNNEKPFQTVVIKADTSFLLENEQTIKEKLVKTKSKNQSSTTSSKTDTTKEKHSKKSQKHRRSETHERTYTRRRETNIERRVEQVYIDTDTFTGFIKSILNELSWEELKAYVRTDEGFINVVGEGTMHILGFLTGAY